MRMGCWGKTKLFEMIAAGELESFLDGRARHITVESIEARIQRKLQESRQTESRLENAAGPPRGRPALSDQSTGATTRRNTTEGTCRVEGTQ
jgi:hypothetical protein